VIVKHKCINSTEIAMAKISDENRIESGWDDSDKGISGRHWPGDSTGAVGNGQGPGSGVPHRAFYYEITVAQRHKT
jgi:hypothetical protein